MAGSIKIQKQKLLGERERGWEMGVMNAEKYFHAVMKDLELNAICYFIIWPISSTTQSLQDFSFEQRLQEWPHFWWHRIRKVQFLKDSAEHSDISHV